VPLQPSRFLISLLCVIPSVKLCVFGEPVLDKHLIHNRFFCRLLAMFQNSQYLDVQHLKHSTLSISNSPTARPFTLLMQRTHPTYLSKSSTSAIRLQTHCGIRSWTGRDEQEAVSWRVRFYLVQHSVRQVCYWFGAHFRRNPVKKGFAVQIDAFGFIQGFKKSLPWRPVKIA